MKLKSMTALQKKRYAYYLKLRASGGGYNALAYAEQAFAEVPKPKPTEAARLLKACEGVHEFINQTEAKIKANAALINRTVKVCRKYGGGYAPNVYQFGGKVHIGVAIPNLDSLKHGLLPRAIKAIERVSGATVGSSSDWPTSLNRDFTARGDLFVITINAYLKDDAKACRRVIVKTEITETPVYKLVCSD